MKAFRAMTSRKVIIIGYIVAPLAIFLAQFIGKIIEPLEYFSFIACIIYTAQMVTIDIWVWSSSLSGAKEMEEIFKYSRQGKKFFIKTVLSESIFRLAHAAVFTGMLVLSDTFVFGNVESNSRLFVTSFGGAVAVILYMFAVHSGMLLWSRHISNKNLQPFFMGAVMGAIMPIIITDQFWFVMIPFSLILSILFVFLTVRGQLKKLRRSYHD